VTALRAHLIDGEAIVTDIWRFSILSVPSATATTHRAETIEQQKHER
jgi:hypothetical protein